MSYEETDLGGFTEHAKVSHRLFVSKDIPIPASGYKIVVIADLGVLGKVYIEYKLALV